MLHAGSYRYRRSVPMISMRRSGTGSGAAIFGASLNFVATAGTLWMQYDLRRRAQKRAEHQRERDAQRAVDAQNALAAQIAAEQQQQQQQFQNGTTVGGGATGGGDGGAAEEKPITERAGFQIALVAAPILLGAILNR